MVICPLITPIIADQMLHAQWVERKHFGSWIQPLEPSVEDSDRLGYLGYFKTVQSSIRFPAKQFVEISTEQY